MDAPPRALWPCPDCGRLFANRRQPHACAPLDLERHFVGRDPVLRPLFEAFCAALQAIGPVRVLPEQTRIAFQVRMSFAQLTPRRAHWSGHLVLAEPHPGPPILRIESLSPRNHVHSFRFDSPALLDTRFQALLRAAYAVGAQQHLRRPAGGRGL